MFAKHAVETASLQRLQSEALYGHSSAPQPAGLPGLMGTKDSNVICMYLGYPCASCRGPLEAVEGASVLVLEAVVGNLSP